MLKQNMKNIFDKHGGKIALFVFGVSILIMSYIIYELSVTKEKIATSYVDNVKERTLHELDNFFIPIKNQLSTTTKQLSLRNIHEISPRKIKRLLLPLMQNYDQIAAVSIETSGGFDFDIVRDPEEYSYFIRFIDSSGYKPVISEANYTYFLNDIQLKSSNLSPDISSIINEKRLPKNILNDELMHIRWSDPKILQTTKTAGITVDVIWKNNSLDSQLVIMAIDLELERISQFTQQLKPTKGGEVMVLANDKNTVIGFPVNQPLEKERYNSLFHLNDLELSELHELVSQATTTSPFHFFSFRENWWGALIPSQLNDDTNLYVAVALPEKDFLKEINESIRLMIGGFFGILLLTLIIVRSHSLQRNQKQLLQVQNVEILEQKELIESKNQEILDSINYAKRIQTAILPPDQLVKSYLKESFILYLPKDIVAGDFYWMERIDDTLFFAAADCTGHGIPGAMVSVMCHNALNRCVRELNLKEPAEILNRSREMVIDEFSQSDTEVHDGMDISLCALDVNTNTLSWAGANNPLWIISAEEIKEKNNLLAYKGDKQPVGNYHAMKPFTNHEIQLSKGDLLYLFSDGLQDQFGGPDNKKFKVGQLKRLVLRICDQPMSEQKKVLENEFNQWMGDQEQIDDVCMIGVKIV